MASGLLKAGVDLDTLFLARVTAPRGGVGYSVAGVDISQRYEPIGAGTPIAATGIKSANTDLASVFRDINSSVATHSLLCSFNNGGGYTQIGKRADTFTGSITPATYGGAQINIFLDQDWPGVPANTGFRFTLGSNVLSNYFNTIYVNGLAFTSASATFTGGANAQWAWPTKAGLVNGNTYPVTIV